MGTGISFWDGWSVWRGAPLPRRPRPAATSNHHAQVRSFDFLSVVTVHVCNCLLAFLLGAVFPLPVEVRRNESLIVSRMQSYLFFRACYFKTPRVIMNQSHVNVWRLCCRFGFLSQSFRCNLRGQSQTETSLHRTGEFACVLFSGQRAFLAGRANSTTTIVENNRNNAVATR